MVAMRTGPQTHPLAFTSTIVPLSIHAGMPLDDVVRVCDSPPFGGNDCALNQAMGAAPVSKRQFYISKFGEARFESMEPHMTKTMAGEGIAVTYDGLISGTLDSHRLQAWAAKQGKENEVVEEVMKQYFEGGKHPGDKLMLAEAAAAAGLDQEAAAAFLETDEGAIEVHQSKKDCSTALHFGLMPDKTSTKPDPQK